MKLISMQSISAAELVQEKEFPHCGAVVCFEGRVRNHHRGRQVSKLYYESYKTMAIKVLKDLVAEVEGEWEDCEISACHRIGELKIGEVAVAIAVWAPHRREAFEACEAMIDRIKERVPIWKKETYQDGQSDWVRCEHHDAL